MIRSSALEQEGLGSQRVLLGRRRHELNRHSSGIEVTLVGELGKIACRDEFNLLGRSRSESWRWIEAGGCCSAG